MVIVPKEDELNPLKVIETMKNENVTRVFIVHKWIEQIQDISIENNIKLDKLRIIGTGAEVLKPKKFEKLLLNNPKLSIYNTYGPTEATMFMTKHKVSKEDILKDSSPIGKLMPTTRAIVLDKDNNALPIGIQGELIIYEDNKSATNIAKGYLNQEKLTSEKFITIKNPISNENIKCYKTGDIVKINNKLELEFVGRQDDFEDDLGLDSLNMTNLYIELNNNKMAIQDLYNYSTIQDLANMMNTELLNKDNDIIKKTNLKIKNNSLKFNLKNILLTGVTGFVGANLLKELVENTEVDKIYCIVRSKLNLSSDERFEKTISEYFDKQICEKIKQKTIIINGDLTQENLGISLEEFFPLFERISTIINCAANVKHIGKYANFYKDNVKTVINLIDICKKYKISLAHISTLSLHGFQNGDSNNIFDENTLNINQTFDKNPYLISKYEAEQKILRAINNNEINAKIFRIGNIMPRMSDGVFQKNFEQNAFMLAIKEIGNIGLQTIEMLNVDLYLTPADECAKAIRVILESSEKKHYLSHRK